MRKSTRLQALLLSFLCTVACWGALPFEVTSIENGSFAPGTKWYSMRLGSDGLYLTDNGTADRITLKSTSALPDADLWCFAGNETDGYRIYNKQAGIGKVLASATTMGIMSGQNGTGGNTYPTLQPADALPAGYVGTWDFKASTQLSDVANGQFIYLHGTQYAMNNFAQLGDLAFWAEGQGAGSTFNIEFIEADLSVDLNTGTFTASNANKTWHSQWSSSQLTGFTFAANANNMCTDADNDKLLSLASGQSQNSTYTITAPSGYIVTGYSFDFRNHKNNNGGTTLTVAGKTYNSTTETQHVEVTGLKEGTASFIVSGTNAPVTLSDFTVGIRKSITPPEPQVEIFITKPNSVPYRIPALAKAHNGDLIAVADYRYSGGDIGTGALDLRARISHDNGQTWGDYFTIVSNTYNGGGNLHTGYGDPAIVADRESNRVLLISCSGNITFQNATRDHHQGIARFYSEDNGKTWSNPTDLSETIYTMFDKSKIGGPRSMFVGSGRIFQSHTVKVGDYYRIYCAILYKDVNGTNKNYVLYSDDFGGTWSALGGIDVAPIPNGADEPKTEELPDGSVLISSRVTGGRYFNIFSFTDSEKAEGQWGTYAFSGADNNGVAQQSNSTNGEIMILPAVRRADNKPVYIALQSLPTASTRARVGISFKELESLADFDTPANFARDWDGCHIVTTLGSAYSTMDLLNDNTIGFLYEEDTYGKAYSIIYKNYSLEQITDSLYAFSADTDADEIVAASIGSKWETIQGYAGTNVGNLMETSLGDIEASYNAYVATPSKTLYEALNRSIADAEYVQLGADYKYRLRNKLYPTLYLTAATGGLGSAAFNENNKNELFSFIPGNNDGEWFIYNENSKVFIGATPAVYNAIPVAKDKNANMAYRVVSAPMGVSYMTCVSPANGSYPAIHLNAQGVLVPWTTGADASQWYIEPTSEETTTGIDHMESATNASKEIFYDLQGRRVANPKNGVFVTNHNRKVIL